MLRGLFGGVTPTVSKVPVAGSNVAAVRIAACPVCAKVFRPRNLATSAHDSVAGHVKQKGRTCALHRAVNEAVGRRQCPAAGCDHCPETREAGWLHLTLATDAVHRRCKLAPAAANNNNPSAVVYNEAAAMRSAERQLYALAKAGRVAAIEALVSTGRVNPNAGGEDGFTPLMTATEAGYIHGNSGASGADRRLPAERPEHLCVRGLASSPAPRRAHVDPPRHAAPMWTPPVTSPANHHPPTGVPRF